MTATYEHFNGIYGRCLENRKVLDSKKVLRISSATDKAAPQFTIGNAGPRNLRRIQHVRVPDEPHVQGGAMKRAIRLEQARQLRNPAVEPINAKVQPTRPKGYAVSTFREQAPRTRSTSQVILTPEPATEICCARPG